MTDPELAAIEAAIAEAAGPIVCDHYEDDVCARYARTGTCAHAELTRAARYAVVGQHAPALLAEVRRLRARVAEVEGLLDEARADVVLAAGELLVPIPPPGTDAARLLLANVAMRRQRDVARREAAEAHARGAEGERARIVSLLRHTACDVPALLAHDCIGYSEGQECCATALAGIIENTPAKGKEST